MYIVGKLPYETLDKTVVLNISENGFILIYTHPD